MVFASYRHRSNTSEFVFKVLKTESITFARVSNPAFAGVVGNRITV